MRFQMTSPTTISQLKHDLHEAATGMQILHFVGHWCALDKATWS